MDRFHLMNVFVAVAEEQGFAGGARRLGMSPPAVTRAIATLEDRLGVKLLNRTTRFVRATDAGVRYLESCPAHPRGGRRGRRGGWPGFMPRRADNWP